MYSYEVRLDHASCVPLKMQAAEPCYATLAL